MGFLRFGRRSPLRAEKSFSGRIFLRKTGVHFSGKCSNTCVARLQSLPHVRVCLQSLACEPNRIANIEPAIGGGYHGGRYLVLAELERLPQLRILLAARSASAFELTDGVNDGRSLRGSERGPHDRRHLLQCGLHRARGASRCRRMQQTSRTCWPREPSGWCAITWSPRDEATVPDRNGADEDLHVAAGDHRDHSAR